MYAESRMKGSIRTSRDPTRGPIPWRRPNVCSQNWPLFQLTCAISEGLISRERIVTTPRRRPVARRRSSRTGPCSPPAPPACAATSAPRCAGRMLVEYRNGDVDAVAQQLLRDALVELRHDGPLAEQMGTEAGRTRRRLGVPRRLALRDAPFENSVGRGGFEPPTSSV